MKSVRFALLTAILVPLPLTAANAASSAATAPDSGTVSTLTSLRVQAEQGDGNAQYELGVAYAQGRQTPRDPIEAFAWLTFAAERGASGNVLASVVDSFTPTQVAQARRRLDALRAAYPSLRAPVAAPKPPTSASNPAPIIGAPNPRSAGSPPVIVVPPDSATPTTESSPLRAQLAAAEASLRDTQATLVQQSSELAARRAESAAVRIELERVKAQLALARETPAPPPATAAAGESAVLLERERTAHVATQSAVADLKRQLGELTTARTTLERELATRTAVAERAQSVASDEAKKLSARTAELTAKSETLTRELATSRSELDFARQTLATAAAAAHAATQAESRLAAARSEAVTLERDLQTAKTTIAQSTAEKLGVEKALAAANEKLTETREEIAILRRRLDESRVLASASVDQKIVALQAELNDSRAKLATADRTVAARNEEVTTLRAAIVAHDAQPKIAPAELDAARQEASKARQDLVAVTQELAGLRQRMDETQRQTSLTSEQKLASLQTELYAARTRLAALEKSTLTRDEELTVLRRQALAATELEARVRQLEAEKAARPVASAIAAISPDDLARATAGRAEAEDKLSTALRSYSLIVRERDELKARVAELNLRPAATAENPTRSTVSTSDVAVRPSIPERAPEPARAETDRVAPSITAVARPATSQPTRPTAAPARPVRTHTIAAGETLTGLALRYYGTATRWPEILAANRDVLPDERSFVAGLTLRIP